MTDENKEPNKALPDKISEETKNTEELNENPRKLDNRPISSEKNDVSLYPERYSLSSSSSSSAKMSHGEIGIIGEETLFYKTERESKKIMTLQDRFEAIFGVSYFSDHELLRKAAWVLKRRPILDWIRDSGITYLARLHRELEDNGYDIAKRTLADFVTYITKIKLVDSYSWYPKSNKYYYTKYIIAPECTDKEIKEVIGERNDADLYYYKKSKSKTKKQLRKGAKMLGSALSDGFKDARIEKVTKKALIVEKDKQKMKEKVIQERKLISKTIKCEECGYNAIGAKRLEIHIMKMHYRS